MHEFWVESEGEAIQMLNNYHLPLNGDVFVGKRGKKRAVGHLYLNGNYFTFDRGSLSAGAQTTCPVAVQNAVQHSILDLITTENQQPRLAFEITYQTLYWKNVAQRLPRVVQSTSSGFDSFLFQKVDPHNTMYNSWVARALQIADMITPNRHCVPIFFDDSNEASQLQMVIDLMISSQNGDNRTYNQRVHALEIQNQSYASYYDPAQVTHGARGKERNWIHIEPHEVTIIVGVKRNCDSVSGINCGVNHCQDSQDRQANRKAVRSKTHLNQLNNGKSVNCVWLSKGTGGMDPYPGLAMLGKLLFCYDSTGRKCRELHVHFKNLPSNFWWLGQNQNEIYYKTLREIADSVSYR